MSFACFSVTSKTQTTQRNEQNRQTNMKHRWAKHGVGRSNVTQTSDDSVPTDPACQLQRRQSFYEDNVQQSSTYTQNIAINFHFHSTSFLFLFARVCTAFPRIKKLNSCHFSFLEGNCHASKYTSQHVIEEVWRWKSQKFSFKTLWPRQLKQWLGSFIYGEELSIATMDLCEADRN